MKKVAIIGSGISGLTAAYELRGQVQLTLFEKNDYLGGHAHTHDIVDEKGNSFTLDTGFLVFNEKTYPNYLGMIKKLGVEFEDSDMSFTLHNMERNFMYSVESLFVQRKNLFIPWYYGLLWKIVRFFKIANARYPTLDPRMTLEEFASTYGISPDVLDYFVIPTAAAIWSAPIDNIRDFPAKSLFIFLKNHGLLAPNKRLQWKTIKHKSRSYIEALIKQVKPRILLNTPIQDLEIGNEKVTLRYEGQTEDFDTVIVATHADTTIKICHKYPQIQPILNKFPYTPSTAILHSDTRVMPPIKRAWSSWNFIAESSAPTAKTSTVYWLNKLQNLSTETPIFISMNPFREIDPSKVIKTLEYSHPLYLPDGFYTQPKLESLSIQNKVFFAGAYHKFGFHEDGCTSGIQAAQKVLRSLEEKVHS